MENETSIRFPCVFLSARHLRHYFREVNQMKRVKAACICQTLHFMLKEELPYEQAVKLVAAEVAHYKATLDRNRTRYRITDETFQSDGSVIVKIIKQYNASPVGEYLD